MDFTPIPISSGAGGSGVAKRKSYQPGAPSPNTSAVLADVLTLSASQREEDDEQVRLKIFVKINASFELLEGNKAAGQGKQSIDVFSTDEG
jgi:hypothetical protein